MSIGIMILGESGTGKSTSMRNLDPEKTLLIQAIRKPLPFRSENWKYWNKETSPDGNIFVTDDSVKIVQAIIQSSKEIIIIDDWQYILCNELMRRCDEKGYDKFTEIGRRAWDILNASISMNNNKRVYLLAHTNTDDSGKVRAKTIGKMLDDKVVVEGMFSIVLRTAVQNGNYLFSTRNNGSDTVKSPIGMFEDELIDNDLKAVDDAIIEFYNLGR